MTYQLREALCLGFYVLLFLGVLSAGGVGLVLTFLPFVPPVPIWFTPIGLLLVFVAAMGASLGMNWIDRWRFE